MPSRIPIKNKNPFPGPIIFCVEESRGLLSFYLLAAVLVAIALIVSGCGKEKSSSGSEGTGQSAPSTAQDSISGSSEDWLAAVCRPGPYSDSAPPVMMQMGAVGGAQCMARQVGGVLVLFSQWDSNFKMRNAMEYTGQCYASVKWSNGPIETFSVVAAVGSNPLAPLRQFGFSATC